MADISLHRTHQLGLEGARSAADQMVEKLKKQFGVTAQWDGNALRFERPGVSGVLKVAAAAIDLEVTLGFLLKAMRGPIERAVHEQLDALLAAPPQGTAPSPAAKAAGKPTAAKTNGAKDPAAKKAPGARKKSG